MRGQGHAEDMLLHARRGRAMLMLCTGGCPGDVTPFGVLCLPLLTLRMPSSPFLPPLFPPLFPLSILFHVFDMKKLSPWEWKRLKRREEEEEKEGKEG
eukprot:1157403-Pelagomonas_calceolata.AAC.9